MRVAAFLQLRNEAENGHLRRCLRNCRHWADEIFIYDDGSDDESVGIYPEYTDLNNVILGSTCSFKSELFHKAELLTLVKKSNPDWIVWIDGDDTLDKGLTDNLRGYLEFLESGGYDSAYLHNRNLWRSDIHYRVDDMFDGLWKINIWKNSDRIGYKPSEGLHKAQHPEGLTRTHRSDHMLLHYGFSSKYHIVKKYLIYKSFGQRGWTLDRLVTESPKFEVKQCPMEWIPDDQMSSEISRPPERIDYREFMRYESWQDFIRQGGIAKHDLYPVVQGYFG